MPKDILVYKGSPANGVLYCSKECAIKDGRTEEKGYEYEEIDEDSYSQTEYGAFCPYCGLAYFSIDF